MHGCLLPEFSGYLQIVNSDGSDIARVKLLHKLAVADGILYRAILPGQLAPENKNKRRKQYSKTQSPLGTLALLSYGFFQVVHD